MTQPINPHVLKEVICQFPNRFCSTEIAKWIKNPTLLQEFRDPNYLSNCTDDQLIAEIKRRGYTGTLNPPSKSIVL